MEIITWQRRGWSVHNIIIMKTNDTLMFNDQTFLMKRRFIFQSVKITQPLSTCFNLVIKTRLDSTLEINMQVDLQSIRTSLELQTF